MVDVGTVPWPNRLWVTRRLRLRTALRGDQIISVLSSHSSGWEPRHGLSKHGYRVEGTARGFKLYRIGATLWYPAMPEAVFDAVVSSDGEGATIEGDVRAPYPQVAMTGFMIAAGLILALVADGAGIAALVLWGGFGSTIYLMYRFGSLPKAPARFAERLAQLTTAEGSLGEPSPVAGPADDGRAPDLFPSRSGAAVYLASLLLFWGGFALISFSSSMTAHHKATSHLDLVGIAALAMMVTGAVLNQLMNTRIQRRLETTQVPKIRTFMTPFFPSTMRAAARTLGLNELMTVTLLYGTLMVAFVLFYARLF
jgi:hypothetical protein